MTKCKSRRLSSHQSLPSTPLDAHRKVNIESQSFRVFYGARGELKRKPFENRFYFGVCGFPKFPNKCWYKMQSSWALLGLPWDSLGLSLAPFGSPLGTLWLPLGCPWAPFGSLSGAFGSLWQSVGVPLNPFGRLGLPCGAFWDWIVSGGGQNAQVP